MNKPIILIDVLVGSSAQGLSSFGSDTNRARVVYFGDHRDSQGTYTEKFNSGTISVFPFSTFISKMFRFQWEAIEILFCSSKNVLSLDKAVRPLWVARVHLLCYQMLDTILNRAEKQFHQALYSDKKRDRIGIGYHPAKVIRSLNMIHSILNCTIQGHFKSQWSGSPIGYFEELTEGMLSLRDVKNIFRTSKNKFQYERDAQTRSPTGRELSRGEGPRAVLPCPFGSDRKAVIVSAVSNVKTLLNTGPKPVKNFQLALDILKKNRKIRFINSKERPSLIWTPGEFPSIMSLIPPASGIVYPEPAEILFHDHDRPERPERGEPAAPPLSGTTLMRPISEANVQRLGRQVRGDCLRDEDEDECEYHDSEREVSPTTWNTTTDECTWNTATDE